MANNMEDILMESAIRAGLYKAVSAIQEFTKRTCMERLTDARCDDNTIEVVAVSTFKFNLADRVNKMGALKDHAEDFAINLEIYGKVKVLTKISYDSFTDEVTSTIILVRD